ncbi:MAG: hypothetical protein K2P12_05620 [Clostridia bacterium]|nr:hypothetical protein [Clostridia bacterium]
MTRLNVVNGMAMLSYLRENNIDLGGEVVPFNEGMCEGETTEDIFSGEFEFERCGVHGVGVEEYEDIVINPLAPLFTFEYDELHLFFDEDMFCQINLITLLAFLDSNEYDGKIALHLIDYDFNEIKCVEIKPQGFYNVYKRVLIDKQIPEIVLPDIMMDAVVNYLDYSKEDNELTEFVQQNINMQENDLLDEMYNRFKYLGLGDIQLQKIIDKAKFKF